MKAFLGIDKELDLTGVVLLFTKELATALGGDLTEDIASDLLEDDEEVEVAFFASMAGNLDSEDSVFLEGVPPSLLFLLPEEPLRFIAACCWKAAPSNCCCFV